MTELGRLDTALVPDEPGVARRGGSQAIKAALEHRYALHEGRDDGRGVRRVNLPVAPDALQQNRTGQHGDTNPRRAQAAQDEFFREAEVIRPHETGPFEAGVFRVIIPRL